jgi:serine/threonine protein kinase
VLLPSSPASGCLPARFLHSCNVWHRDIKSANILLQLSEGRRIAKVRGPTHPLRQPAQLMHIHQVSMLPRTHSQYPTATGSLQLAIQCRPCCCPSHTGCPAGTTDLQLCDFGSARSATTSPAALADMDPTTGLAPPVRYTSLEPPMMAVDSDQPSSPVCSAPNGTPGAKFGLPPAAGGGAPPAAPSPYPAGLVKGPGSGFSAPLTYMVCTPCYRSVCPASCST